MIEDVVIIIVLTVLCAVIVRHLNFLKRRVENVERVTSAHLGITQSLCSDTQRAILDAALGNREDADQAKRRKMN